MALIKVTGYIDTDGLPLDQIDLNHEMGLSTEGFEQLSGITTGQSAFSLSSLEDLEFELEA